MKFKAIIFDMDGVLIDSERYWREREHEVWESFGIEYTKELAQKTQGLNLTDAHKLIQEYKPAVTFEQAVKAFEKVAHKIYYGLCNLIPGVEKFVQQMHEAQIPMVIGSSSQQEWIEDTLEHFPVLKKGISKYYSTQTEGFPGKPDPTVYTELITYLKLQPEEVVIFEDSTTGLKAAKASGAFTIAVYDPTMSHADTSLADEVISSFEDKKLYTYLGIE
ncbi:MAG: HAD family phosphatase [Candidatus Jacksonbacteria bacterium]|jgi:HAD superfamily hydrolase (TIGR01509 family)|nr:HAD family phosphatase [Candidatus Jacksonbacteria bacterium]